MRAKEEVEDAVAAAFLEAPIRRRRRRRLGRSNSKSSTLGLSDSQEADSSDRSFKGSSDDSNFGDEEGEKEEEEDDDDEEEEMEYLPPGYLQENSGDDTDAYVPRSL